MKEPIEDRVYIQALVFTPIIILCSLLFGRYIPPHVSTGYVILIKIVCSFTLLCGIWLAIRVKNEWLRRRALKNEVKAKEDQDQ